MNRGKAVHSLQFTSMLPDLTLCLVDGSTQLGVFELCWTVELNFTRKEQDGFTYYRHFPGKKCAFSMLCFVLKRWAAPPGGLWEGRSSDEAEVSFDICCPDHLCPRPTSQAAAVRREAARTVLGWLESCLGLPSKSSQPIKHLMFSVPQECCTSVLPMYLSSFIFNIL